MDWILLPESRELSVRWGTPAPIKVVFDGTQPVVIIDGKEYYPVAWEGPPKAADGVSKWTYKGGPVTEIYVWVSGKERWIRVHWRF